MTLVPSVAAIEVHPSDEEVQPHTEFGTGVVFENNHLSWWVDDDHGRGTEVVGHRDGGLNMEFTLPDDAGTVRVRELDPYDGVVLAAGAGVPQPVEVLRADVENFGGVVAQELTAVVAADNTVVTLLLETGIGLYVRFSGDWQRLSATSTALEDTSLLKVSPGAVDIFDAADMANTTLSAFDLPRTETIEGVEFEINPEAPEDNPISEDGPVVASGITIPRIMDLDDLDLAIRHASRSRGARWYVERRAAALGATERIPMDWRS